MNTQYAVLARSITIACLGLKPLVLNVGLNGFQRPRQSIGTSYAGLDDDGFHEDDSQPALPSGVRACKQV